MGDGESDIDSGGVGRVVLFGHTGFIGSSLRVRLEKEYPGELQCFSTEQVDLTDREEVQRLWRLFDMHTVVILCSAIKRQGGDDIESLDKNLQMTMNLCHVIRDHPIKRMIYLSSTAVYGEDVQHDIISEETPESPTSFYGIAKYTCEQILMKVFGVLESSSLAIVRPPAVYGPGESELTYGPSMFGHAIANEEDVTLWGDGSELREFLYIDDLVELLVRLSFHQFEGVLNTVSGRSVSFLEMLRKLEQVSGMKVCVSERPRSKAKVDNVFDSGRLKSLFPDFQFTDIVIGLECVFNAFKSRLDAK